MRDEASKIHRSLITALQHVDDSSTAGPRLLDEAERLFSRTRKLLLLNLIDAQGVQIDSLQLACYALQLPLRQTRASITGKLGRTNLRDRAEAASEMLIGILEEQIDDSLLDRTTQLLNDLPGKTPSLPEAKLLADAIALDDFSLLGLFQQAMQLALQGQGPMQVVEGFEKRQQYGYFDARLKDGFHFEPIRQMARKRLDQLREVGKWLTAERDEDRV